jgi:hypothetical protein
MAIKQHFSMALDKHARSLKERRGEQRQDVVVEQRPLAVYDGLIA